MKKVESYSEVSAAVMRHFRRTTVTNCFIDRATYEREINAGTLLTEEDGNGLYIYRERDGFRILNFYLNSPDVPLADIPADTVCEIAYRDRDEGLKTVSARFADNGFEHKFTRVRLARTAEIGDFSVEDVSSAEDADFASVRALMHSAFDRRTGCLPTDDALRADISEGHVLVYKTDSVVGLLHFNEEKNSSDIRHVAVDENHRGEGIASALVRAYISSRDKKCRVWAREDYAAARRVYEKNGYLPDGMKSDVLIKENNKGMVINMNEEKKKLLDILSDIVPGVDFESEEALIDDGLLESLDIVSIVSEIMVQFDVEINVDDLLPENFNSADAILALIKAKQE